MCQKRWHGNYIYDFSPIIQLSINHSSCMIKFNLELSLKNSAHYGRLEGGICPWIKNSFLIPVAHRTDIKLLDAWLMATAVGSLTVQLFGTDVAIWLLKTDFKRKTSIGTWLSNGNLRHWLAMAWYPFGRLPVRLAVHLARCPFNGRSICCSAIFGWTIWQTIQMGGWKFSK